jgi:hypothetical protein
MIESEIPKAATPKRKRRWFQFRLRSLLIGVTLLAVPMGYVGWQVKIVRERRALRENPQFCEPFFLTEDSQGTSALSWMRRLFGDVESVGFIADDNVTDAELERCRAAFPEADVRRDRDQPTLDHGMEFHFRNGTLTSETKP